MSRVATSVTVVFKRDEKDVSAGPSTRGVITDVIGERQSPGPITAFRRAGGICRDRIKQVALINLERFEAQADELGSAGKGGGPPISGRSAGSSSYPWNRTSSVSESGSRGWVWVTRATGTR